MENSKKPADNGKKKQGKKLLSELDSSLKTDGDKIHGGADVRVTTDVPKG